MELIKALEQLSLEVRNKNEKLNISEIPLSPFPNNQCHSNNTQHNALRNHENHLIDFNNSIETLFTQITDLETSVPKYESDVATSVKRNKFAHPSSREQDYLGGSMETSQEEDSDCSLQQSSNYYGCTDKKAAQFNPLVRDLMKRDLGAITDTVRKISRILTIGNDIELAFNKYLSGQQVNLAYTRTLCDAFTELCANEPHIKAMPTISRYSGYCKQFMTQLGQIDSFCSTGTNTANLQPYNCLEKSNCSSSLNQTLHCDENVCDIDCEEDDFDYDELDDFNTNEISANTWTNNKLYIDSNQSFK